MAKVKRRHREKACEALLMGVSDQALHYVDTGETPDSDLDEDGICDGVHGVAQAIADAEERGRLRERADVRAELDHTMANANAQAGNSTGQLKTALGAVSAVLKSTIRLLDTGGHIGAAEKYRKD